MSDSNYTLIFDKEENKYTVIIENGQGSKGDPGPPGVLELSNTTATSLVGYIIGNGSTITANPRIDGGNF